jgi:hypothetical protein
MEILLSRYGVLKDTNGNFVELGKGAWGSTFKAIHTGLYCTIALKLLPRDAFKDEASRQKFLADARAAVEIRHQNIALVLPISAEEEAYVYSTEFLDGESLAETIAERTALSPAVAAGIAAEVAAALKAISSRGMVHYHLMPSSILLLWDDEEVRSKLLDLALPPEPGGAQGRFEAFRSPEELAGGQVDFRSNLYSLGVLICYMLAGQENFPALVGQIVRAAESAGDAAPWTAGALAGVLMRFLKQDPSARFHSASEACDALDAVLHAGPEEIPIVPVEVIPEPLPEPIPEPPPEPAPAVAAQPSLEATRTGHPTLFATHSSEQEGMEYQPVAETPEAGEESGGLALVPLVESSKGDSIDSGVTIAPGDELRIPEAMLDQGEPGTILILTPRAIAGAAEIRIVARKEFRIGRSQKLGADLVARYMPRSPKNDRKTQLLSKIHVIAKAAGPDVMLFDGDGTKQSLNGSGFGETRLSPKEPCRLEGEGVLTLDKDYFIEVKPVFAGEAEVEISNLDHWKGTPMEENTERRGVIYFIPRKPNDISIGAWIFTCARFATRRSTGEIMPEEVVFHRCHGCFWVEGRTAAVTVNGIPVRRGVIAPLATGQVIEIEGGRYEVGIAP